MPLSPPALSPVYTLSGVAEVRPPQPTNPHAYTGRNSMETECPECAGKVSIASPEKGEIVECPECGVELEVVSVSPPALALAPEEEEDWGE